MKKIPLIYQYHGSDQNTHIHTEERDDIVRSILLSTRGIKDIKGDDGDGEAPMR